MGWSQTQKARLLFAQASRVTGDCVYGNYTDIRMWLEEERKCYVMSVSGKAYVWRGYKQESVGSILKNLPTEGWPETEIRARNRADFKPFPT